MIMISCPYNMHNIMTKNPECLSEESLTEIYKFKKPTGYSTYYLSTICRHKPFSKTAIQETDANDADHHICTIEDPDLKSLKYA